MNLKDQPRDQVIDCLTWMDDVSKLESPPSPLLWAEVRQGLRRRARFLEEFVVPEIAPVTYHLFEGRELPTDQRNGHESQPQEARNEGG